MGYCSQLLLPGADQGYPGGACDNNDDETILTRSCHPQRHYESEDGSVTLDRHQFVVVLPPPRTLYTPSTHLVQLTAWVERVPHVFPLPCDTSPVTTALSSVNDYFSSSAGSTNSIVEQKPDFLLSGLRTNSGFEDTEEDPFCAIANHCPCGPCIAFMCGCSAFSPVWFFWQKMLHHNHHQSQHLPGFSQSSQHHSQFWSLTSSVGVLQMLSSQTMRISILWSLLLCL